MRLSYITIILRHNSEFILMRNHTSVVIVTKLPQWIVALRRGNKYWGEIDMAFTQKKKVIIHLRIHTGEIPYQCDKCGNTTWANVTRLFWAINLVWLLKYYAMVFGHNKLWVLQNRKVSSRHMSLLRPVIF